MTAPFEVEFSTLPLAIRYKLLAALVVPRPIALVTTAGKDGVINAAPFSFFNVFSEDPALVVLGLQSRPDGTPKDTLKHIRETGVFVVNLVDEAMAERMNTCSIDFPSNVSEIGMTGFAILPGVGVPVPRIAEAPVALECRHYTTLEVSHRRHLCIGQRGPPACPPGHHRPRAVSRESRRLQADRAAIWQSLCAPRRKIRAQAPVPY
ncbi:flavin reductase (DIM6/NTAB) family NADH-FMN oxidoreductase RutF [Bradyrhizobium sp. AZCC 2262]|uniref:flavin reductase family protein n=1 Tax=Bradyrhizobium sp. AZCC 2262 TaxID=3117022 RepID=UPI002FF292E1